MPRSIPSSLACHVYFMLCSIVSLGCFCFFFNFISYSSCTPHASSFILVQILFSFPPSSWLICLFMTKKGESIPESIHIGKYRHFYITHVHILRGRNSTSCTFVRGESHRRDANTKGEKTFFLWENLVFFALLYACFLIVYGALSYI